VAVLRKVVVADAVEADRHDAAVIGTVLAVVVAFTPFDARNFRGLLGISYATPLFRSNKMRKHIHRKIDRNSHANNHGEGFVFADEPEQGFSSDLFTDPLVMFFPGTVPTMMTMG